MSKEGDDTVTDFHKPVSGRLSKQIAGYSGFDYALIEFVDGGIFWAIGFTSLGIALQASKAVRALPMANDNKKD